MMSVIIFMFAVCIESGLETCILQDYLCCFKQIMICVHVMPYDGCSHNASPCFGDIIFFHTSGPEISQNV